MAQRELGYLIPSTEKSVYVASEAGADARLDNSLADAVQRIGETSYEFPRSDNPDGLNRSTRGLR